MQLLERGLDMNLSVDIDSNSGFCNGVVRAVRKAEDYLQNNEKLYSLGAIVHNDTELERLSHLGLEVIDYEGIKALRNKTVLIRAHGEPPQTYKLAQTNSLELIDCTCPVVLKLQQRIKEIHKMLSETGGTIIIFGKKGHAEVNGLVGNVNGEAIVVESVEDVESITGEFPFHIFSQTTRDPQQYQNIISAIKNNFSLSDDDSRIIVYNTICKQVSNRYDNLKQYADSHTIIIFVCGQQSSNGRVLYNYCKSINPRTYMVENYRQVDKSWFFDYDKVGICGATSTPRWQLEEVVSYINNSFNI